MYLRPFEVRSLSRVALPAVDTRCPLLIPDMLHTEEEGAQSHESSLQLRGMIGVSLEEVESRKERDDR